MWEIDTHNLWSTFDGVALEGPHAGVVMPRIPSLQTTWSEWQALHPDTDVILWEPWPTHSDARHGHGSNKFLGSPGVAEHFLATIEVGGLDSRLPENALALGVQVHGQPHTYPLLEVRKENNVVNDDVAGEATVVFASPNTHTMAAYQRRLDDRVLEFVRERGVFKDRQTGSTWNIEGVATAGPLQGKRLSPLDYYFTEWHSWAAYHPETNIFTSHEGSALRVEAAGLARLVGSLHDAGYAVEVESEYLEPLLPLNAENGLTATVNGDRLSLFIFRDTADASDYVALRPHSAQVGHGVVQSDPLDVYTDESRMTRKDDAQIDWSALTDDQEFIATVRQALGQTPPPSGRKSYLEIFAALRAAGYRVEPEKLMIGYILPPKAIHGVWASINGDRFMVIKFPDAASAEEHAEERAHRVSAQHVVFRSDPERQYRIPDPVLTVELPDDQIDWSALTNDAGFQQAIQAAVGT